MEFPDHPFSTDPVEGENGSALPPLVGLVQRSGLFQRGGVQVGSVWGSGMRC